MCLSFLTPTIGMKWACLKYGVPTWLANGMFFFVLKVTVPTSTSPIFREVLVSAESLNKNRAPGSYGGRQEQRTHIVISIVVKQK